MAVTSKQSTMRDGSPHGGARIDVHVGEIRQLFNSMDLAPLRLAAMAAEVHVVQHPV